MYLILVASPGNATRCLVVQEYPPVLEYEGGDHEFKVHRKLTDEIQKSLLCLNQETL